jgi:arabinogalactan oligomer/maltooligosaccharide transport system permease protein
VATTEHAETSAAIAAPTRAVARTRRGRPKLRDTWWRHAVAIGAMVIALFPVAYTLSSAFNRDNSLQGATLVPTHVTLHNFGSLLHNNVTLKSGGKTDAPYLRWVFNSMVIAGTTALLTTLLGALAAYAFSRFRFKGRRLGMIALLLIQMFPQFLAVVAIFLMFATITDYWPAIGFNTWWGLTLLYLGGALGVGTWLMKGFFDTVPRELDESATMDGASHVETFFRILLPLVAPVLAVTGLLAFISTINEFVFANVFLTDSHAKTLSVGLWGLVAADQRNNNFGMFCAGTLLTAIPTVAVFQALQRYIVEGLTAGAVKG